MTRLDAYRAEPPHRHPDQAAVYVSIPVTTVDTEEPATVRGWTCPRCWTWTRRSFAIADYELVRAAVVR